MSLDPLEILFHELSELGAEERRSRLEEIRRSDGSLHAELSSLLEAHAASEGFLAPPSGAASGGEVGAPARIGKYAVVSEIGRGASGVVFLAHDPDLERRIAIKIFARGASTARRVEELRDEAKALAQITHPNVAQVYSIEEVAGEAGQAALTMEFVPGATLAQRLREGPLPLRIALDYGRQIAAGLEATHRQGVIHRDLKPQNLRVTPDGWVKILDFGLSRQGRGGTPGYMSPEQCRGETTGAGADLFAFGVVLYEVLAGRPAFSGATMLELLESNRRGEVGLEGLPAALPPALHGLLLDLLAVEPARRLASAGQARQVLEEELLRLRASDYMSAQARPAAGGADGGGGADAGDAPASVARAAHLPRPWSSFIGREESLAALERELSVARLVTVTGPGGVGKTRIALETAARLEGAHPAGIWFVDLAAWSEEGDVAAAVVRTLQRSAAVKDGRPETAVAAVAAAFGEGPGLLLLDNCEHLSAPVAAFVEPLLGLKPELRVLTTSRHPLGLPGESVFVLPPLELPSSRSESAEEPAGAAETEAVRLFLARARSRSPRFAPGAATLAQIGRICRRLDGLPLAIELAAGQVRSMSLDEILRRVEEGRTLAAAATGPMRHRSLRDLIEWSYRLLAPAERSLLRRLSVFRGGCTLAAAEAVCGESDGLHRWDVCDALSRLVEHSLVEPEVVEAGPEDSPPAARYRLLETIRMFAAERLAENELESGVVIGRYLGFIETLVSLREGENAASRARWIHRVGPDYANIIHGLELALAHRRIDLAGHIGELTAYYWVQTGEWIEGMGWLDRILAARTGPAPDPGIEAGGTRAGTRGGTSEHRIDPAVEVRLLSQAGLLPTLLRMHEKAAPILAEALARGTALGLPGPLALAHETNGVAAWHQGEFETARGHVEKAVQYFEQAGDRGALAINAGNLGVLEATQGHFESACERYRLSQRLCAELGDRLAGGKALINLGWALLQLQRFDESEEALREALAVHEEFHELPAIVMAHHNLGELFVAKGDFPAARRHMHEARALRARMGDRGGLAASLPHFYMLLEKEGRLETAAVILQGLLHLLDQRGVPARPESRRRFGDWRDALEQRLGPETMARCGEAAAELDLEGLLDLAESTAIGASSGHSGIEGGA